MRKKHWQCYLILHGYLQVNKIILRKIIQAYLKVPATDKKHA